MKTAKLTAKQIRTSVAMAARIHLDAPETTFHSLRVRADEAFGTDEGRILDAVVVTLDARSDAARAASVEFAKVNPDLVDENVTSENMASNLEFKSIGYWPEFFRHSVAVAVCNAENSGASVNWTPAARCVY